MLKALSALALHLEVCSRVLLAENAPPSLTCQCAISHTNLSIAIPAVSKHLAIDDANQV